MQQQHHVQMEKTMPQPQEEEQKMAAPSLLLEEQSESANDTNGFGASTGTGVNQIVSDSPKKTNTGKVRQMRIREPETSTFAENESSDQYSLEA